MEQMKTPINSDDSSGSDEPVDSLPHPHSLPPPATTSIQHSDHHPLQTAPSPKHRPSQSHPPAYQPLNPPPFNPPRPIAHSPTRSEAAEAEHPVEPPRALGPVGGSYYVLDRSCFFPTTRCNDWCCACLCIWCMAYQHRQDVLGPDWESRYTCCQDLYTQCHPSCVFCRCCSDHCPEFSLVLESIFCYGLAIAGSRYQFNRDQRLQDRPFEKFTGNTLFCLECCGFIPVIGPILSRSVASCLLVQQDVELRYRGFTSNLHLDADIPRSRHINEKTSLLSKQYKKNKS